MPPKRKIERKYEDAFFLDLNRLSAEYEKLEKILETKPTDAKSLAAKAKLKPLLERKSLEARLAHAQKLDREALGKVIDTFTF